MAQKSKDRLTLRIVFAAVLAATASLAIPAQAVVIVNGDGSSNTSAPEDDPGFAHVGARGIGGAVYLGKGWVLSAAHIGAGPVTFDNQEYANDPSTTTRVTNPEGYTPLTDMVMFKLIDPPDLPSLRLPCESPRILTEVTLVGAGHDRNLEATFWDVQFKTGNGNDVWTVVEAESAGDRTGYGTLDTKSVRWGDNDVSALNLEVESARGDTVYSFQTTFDKDDRFSTEYESQGVRGDSGGAAFQKNDDDQWELVGLIHAITLHDNQPGAIRSAIFGNNTYIADMAFYADELRAIGEFEADLGDIDGDSVLSTADIDLLSQAIRAQNSSCHFDLSGDGNLDDADIESFLLAAGALRGDADLDGGVGFADFLRLGQTFGKEGDWSRGDFTGDGIIQFDDFLVLTQNFGKTFEGVQSTAAVPEPTSWFLLILAIFSVGSLARRRARHAGPGSQ